MSEHDLDRAIDTAARQLIAREPSRALNHNVMARVRGDVKSPTRKFMWAAAAASVVVSVASAAMLLNRAPHALPSLPAARPLAMAEPNTTVDASITAANEVRPARRTGSTPNSRRAQPMSPLRADVPPIEQLVAEPIVVAAIDVPRLEPEQPVSVEALKIDELTIEPLAASND